MIQTNISPARRKEIKKAVYETLCNYPVPFIPLKIKSLVRSFPNIRLISYSKHMKHMGLTYSQMIRFANTMDACTDYYAESDIYIVYYNDIEKSITLSNRYRWNIAHELGHIILQHQKAHNKTRIFRSELSDPEYDELEAEADYFAQLILVPHVVLYAFKITTAKQLKELCQISNPAAIRRFHAYQQWEKHINGNDIYDRPLFHYYYNFIYKKHCRTCDAYMVQGKGNYCPICGNKTLQWGDGKMKYTPKIVLDQNSKAVRCPVCDNEEISPVGNYCHICGTFLVNQCTNTNFCGELAAANARYCIHCGSETTFFQNNLLDAWNQPSSTNFMDIPDDILDLPNSTQNIFDEDEDLPFN